MYVHLGIIIEYLKRCLQWRAFTSHSLHELFTNSPRTVHVLENGSQSWTCGPAFRTGNPASLIGQSRWVSRVISSLIHVTQQVSIWQLLWLVSRVISSFMHVTQQVSKWHSFFQFESKVSARFVGDFITCNWCPLMPTSFFGSLWISSAERYQVNKLAAFFILAIWVIGFRF